MHIMYPTSTHIHALTIDYTCTIHILYTYILILYTDYGCWTMPIMIRDLYMKT